VDWNMNIPSLERRPWMDGPRTAGHDADGNSLFNDINGIRRPWATTMGPTFPTTTLWLRILARRTAGIRRYHDPHPAQPYVLDGGNVRRTGLSPA
jgi:hypothetical protein